MWKLFPHLSVKPTVATLEASSVETIVVEKKKWIHFSERLQSQTCTVCHSVKLNFEV